MTVGGERPGTNPAAPVRRRIAARALLALAAWSLAAGAGSAHATGPSRAPRADGVRAVCPPTDAASMRCDALELTEPAVGPATDAARASARPVAGAAQTPECHPPLASEGCLGLRPQDLHSAYELPEQPAAPQTIAILTAGGDRRIAHDLANYDREFALEGCGAETECPTVVNGEGEPHPLPAAIGEVSLETSLDVEIAHGVCPGCKLLLVEASAASLPAFEEAADTAVRLGADEISISWGEAEPAQVTEAGAAFDHPGVVIAAAAGDTGYLNWASPEVERGRPEYPASSPDVIAVGGTSLQLGSAGEWQGEQVWNQLEPKDEASGSGCSTLFPAPAWQLELPDAEALGCEGRRATADIAAIADMRLGVAVYDSEKDSEGRKFGWRRVGGTSAATPVIAAAFALAGGAHGVAHPAQTLYANAARDPGLLHEIKEGTNGACRRVLGRGCTPEEQAADCESRPICLAAPGYDGPTGLGSLHGIGALEPPLSFRTPPPPTARRGESFVPEAVVEDTGVPVPVGSATPAICTVADDEVVLRAAGTCTLTAAQPGYLEAQQSFAVGRSLQQVTFTSAAPGSAVAGGDAYLPAASATSGLTVTFVSLTPTVCEVQSGAVVPLAAGLCTIAAGQGGDAEYEPAGTAMQSYAVAARQVLEVLSFIETPKPFAGPPSLQLRGTPSISRRDGAITLSLAARPGGTVSWLVTFPAAGRCPLHTSSCARRLVRYSAGSRTLAAGSSRLTVRPSAAALRALQGGHTLRVRVVLDLTTGAGKTARLSATAIVRLAPSR